MLPKYRKKTYILNQLHKGFVMFCIGVTVLGASFLVTKGFYYYRHVRPALREKKMKNDEELLEEGKYKALG